MSERLARAVRLHDLDVCPGEPPYLIACGERRWQVGRLVFQVARFLDGRRTPAQVAGLVSARLGYPVAPQTVERLISDFFRPAGLVGARTPAGDGRIASLRFAWTILPAACLQPFTALLAPLFLPLPFLVLICLAVAARLYVLAGGLPLLPDPGLSPGAWYAVAWLSFLVHEIGHAAACRRLGVPVRGVGAGLYRVFPVLFTDVRASWTLPRAGRMLVDAGGVYLQALLATPLYLMGGAAAQAAQAIDLLVLVNLNPLFHFDGYWLLSDALGLPNLGARGSAALRAFRQGRPLPPRGRLLLAYALARQALRAAFWLLLTWSLPRFVGALGAACAGGFWACLSYLPGFLLRAAAVGAAAASLLGRLTRAGGR